MRNIEVGVFVVLWALNIVVCRSSVSESLFCVCGFELGL